MESHSRYMPVPKEYSSIFSFLGQNKVLFFRTVLRLSSKQQKVLRVLIVDAEGNILVYSTEGEAKRKIQISREVTAVFADGNCVDIQVQLEQDLAIEFHASRANNTEATLKRFLQVLLNYLPSTVTIVKVKRAFDMIHELDSSKAREKHRHSAQASGGKHGGGKESDVDSKLAKNQEDQESKAGTGVDPWSRVQDTEAENELSPLVRTASVVSTSTAIQTNQAKPGNSLRMRQSSFKLQPTQNSSPHAPISKPAAAELTLDDELMLAELELVKSQLRDKLQEKRTLLASIETERTVAAKALEESRRAEQAQLSLASLVLLICQKAKAAEPGKSFCCCDSTQQRQHPSLALTKAYDRRVIDLL
jgi:hypothetical protein